MPPASAHGRFLPTCDQYSTDPHMYISTTAIFLASKLDFVSSLLTVLHDFPQLMGILWSWPARTWPLGCLELLLYSSFQNISGKHLLYIQECNCSLSYASSVSPQQLQAGITSNSMQNRSPIACGCIGVFVYVLERMCVHACVPMKIQTQNHPSGLGTKMLAPIFFWVVAVVELISRLWLCDPMDCSLPASSVLHWEVAWSHLLRGISNFRKDILTSCKVFQWLGLQASTAGGPGSIPTWGTKILHVVWRGQKKSKRNKTNKKLETKK